MIREMHLKNFKSFTNTTFNFLGPNKKPQKIIFLYGPNGSGKSNFIDVFYCLSCTFETLNAHNFLMKRYEENKADFSAEILSSFADHYNLNSIINRNKTINSSENMCIEFSFLLDGKTGSYYVEFDNTQIVKETLEYTLTKNKGIYYSVTSKSAHFNPSVFSGMFLDELKNLKKKYWGRHSIMSILVYMLREYSKEFIASGAAPSLNNILDYMLGLTCHLVEHKSGRDTIGYFGTLLSDFDEGSISPNEKDKLKKTETIINYFYTNLYHDILKTYYKIDSLDSNNLRYSLYFQKKLPNSVADINYKYESCGTRSLLNLLPFFIATAYDGVVAIDEVDNGIHDVLLFELINKIIPFIHGQLILTTHNTMFLNEYYLKDNIYIINVSEDGQKTISSITSSDYRIQKSSNVSYNYINGRLGGIPIINPKFDFNAIGQLVRTRK